MLNRLICSIALSHRSPFVARRIGTAGGASVTGVEAGKNAFGVWYWNYDTPLQLFLHLNSGFVNGTSEILPHARSKERCRHGE